MNRKGIGAIVILIVVGSLLVIGGGYLAFRDRSVGDSVLADKPYSFTEEVDTDRAVNTEGWKTYRSEILGFEFRYPHYCEIDYSVESGVSLFRAVCREQGMQFSVQSHFYSWDYLDLVNKSDHTIDKFLEITSDNENIDKYKIRDGLLLTEYTRGHNTFGILNGFSVNFIVPSASGIGSLFVIENAPSSNVTGFVGVASQVRSTLKLAHQKDSANSSTEVSTVGWKTYQDKDFGYAFSYPNNYDLSIESPPRVELKVSRDLYARLHVACVSDPGISQKVHDNYLEFDQRKFGETLGYQFESYLDRFGYRDPVATLRSGMYNLFVFKGGQFCDVSSCAGNPDRLLSVACISGLNKNSHRAAKCLSILSKPLSTQQDRDEYITDFLSTVTLSVAFSDVSECIGEGERKG